VRETLFNWLGQTLHGRRCLDLFAGSGALGFEAASRGADLVVMVEKSRQVYQALRRNIENLGFKTIELHCADGMDYAPRDGRRYDVIFLDPPFNTGYLPGLLPLLGSKLEADGVIYVESGTIFHPGPGWQVERRGRAGAVHYQLLKQAEEAA
jgi:16S rRNA (guanine966-N2)-methyltransferase